MFSGTTITHGNRGWRLVTDVSDERVPLTWSDLGSRVYPEQVDVRTYSVFETPNRDRNIDFEGNQINDETKRVGFTR